MTETSAVRRGARPAGPRPRLALAVLSAIALGACEADAPPPDPAPFVEGLEGAGLLRLGYGEISRDGSAYVLSGVKAVTRAGLPLAAREVRFEEVRSLRPLDAGRVVVTELDAGQVRAGRIEVLDVRDLGARVPGGKITAERFEGRLAGYPFKVRHLSREGLGQVGRASVRFVGLSPDAPLFAGSAGWDGSLDVGEPGGDGTVRVSFLASAGEARLGLQARLAGYAPGVGPDAMAFLPFVPLEGNWETLPVRGVTFRSEGVRFTEGGLSLAANGPAADIAGGVAKGDPVAVVFEPGGIMPLGAAWSRLTSSEGHMPGLSVRIGDREAVAR